MKINNVRGLRAAIDEYKKLEADAPYSPRRQELWAAISDYQRRFEASHHNPGQPFHDLTPPPPPRRP